jgi:hypothetical protein
VDFLEREWCSGEHLSRQLSPARTKKIESGMSVGRKIQRGRPRQVGPRPEIRRQG